MTSPHPTAVSNRTATVFRAIVAFCRTANRDMGAVHSDALATPPNEFAHFDRVSFLSACLDCDQGIASARIDRLAFDYDLRPPVIRWVPARSTVIVVEGA